MSVKVQSYSLELKAQAVRMAMEDGLGIKETGKWLPIPSGTLAGWVAKISREPSALAPGEQIVQVANGARNLKKSSSVLFQGVAAKYTEITLMRQDYPVRLLCQCFKVSFSGYYDWSIR